MEKELKVSAIKNGTVIDRIPSKSLFKVISILGLENCHNQITFGMNLESKNLGNKAIIKVTDRYFENEDINRIALVAPSAKLNVIKNYAVVEKRIVEVPNEIEGIVKCMNPKCVTNHEKIATKFKVISKNDDVVLLCHYCEKITEEKNFEISSTQ